MCVCVWAAMYFLAVLVVLAASTVFTVIVLNSHHRGDLGEEVPPWMRKVVLQWLACLVGQYYLVEINQKKHKVSSNKVSLPQTHTCFVSATNIKLILFSVN